MKAELVMENVGGLKGKHQFELKSKTLNIVESPNALGKSTVIKSLAAVLSLPCKSPLAIEIAHHIGIKNRETGGQEPLVNVEANLARVTLRLNGEQRICEISKAGNINVKPEGDDSFLLTSVLTRETEITRRLVDGESNFEWIIKNVSLAETYEKVGAVVEKWLNLARLQLGEIEGKREAVSHLEKSISELKQSEKKLRGQISEAEQKLKTIPSKDPTLETAWEEIRSQLRDKESVYQSLEKDVREAEKQLTPLEKQLGQLKRVIEEQLKGIKEAEARIKKLPTKEEIKAWNQEIQHIVEVEIPRLSEGKGKIEGVINLYERAIQIAEKEKKKEIPCPLCKEGTVTMRYLETEKAELQRQLTYIENKLSLFVNRKNELIARIQAVERDRKKLDDQIIWLRSELRHKERQVSEIEVKVKVAKASVEHKSKELEGLENEISKLQKRLNEIEERRKALGGEERRMFELLGRLRNELEAVERQAKQREHEIWEKSMSSVENVPISLKAAEDVYKRWVKILEDAFSYTRSKAKEQKVAAVRAFNLKIKDLMGKLGFSEFEDLWINEETFELHVLRRGKKPQSIASLSSSEKYAMATLLQIAIKEAYMPDCPFFIVDELVLDFDRRRRDTISDYFGTIAKKRDWFIVLARIGEGDSLVVKYT